jgi:hypothetical protein
VGARRTQVVDQIVSSATNGLLPISIAQSATSYELGGFGISYFIVAINLGVVRSAISEVVILNSKNGCVPTTSRLLTTLICAAAPIAGIGVALSYLCDGWIAEYLVVLSAASVLISIQDGIRLGLIAAHHPRAALGIDLIWMCSAILALISARMSACAGPGLIWLWVSGCGASIIVGVVQYARLKVARVRTIRGWRIGVANAADSIGNLAAGQVALMVVAAGSGLDSVSAVRNCQLLHTPIAAMLAGLRFSFLSGSPTAERGELWLRFSIAVGLVWTAGCLCLPEVVLMQLFGESADLIEPLPLLLLLVGLTMGSGASAAADLLRVRRKARHLMLARLFASVTMVVCTLLAVRLSGDLFSISLGRCAAFVIAFTVWWGFFRMQIIELRAGKNDGS